MEQDRLGQDVVPAGVWAEARDKEEADWAGLMPPDPAEIVSARNVDIRFTILQAGHAAKEPARNVDTNVETINNHLFYERITIMTRGDGTGPAGAGPMTGRAAGYCAGYPVPGFMNPVGGRGYWGHGRGFWGCGGGRGWRYRFWAPYYPANVPQVTAQQELEYLRQQAEYLKTSLDEINKRVEQLQTEGTK
jgi:hypothetical protein